ncbi:hypothetical protein [Mycolicibacterium holsaticum]|nr:hypothetical protein [Mycolicibacterium holsaticum]
MRFNLLDPNHHRGYKMPREELNRWAMIEDPIPAHALADGPPFTDADLDALIHPRHRSQTPTVLLNGWRTNRITQRQLQVCLGWSWTRCGRPEDILTPDEWLELFHAAGFTLDGQPATPIEGQILYRGSPFKYRRAWCWTPIVELAQAYAQQPERVRTSKVWVTRAPAAAQLAYVPDRGEFILDTRNLLIHEYGKPLDIRQARL